MEKENNIKEIEDLFLCQDINKMLKLNTTTEEQLRQVERIEKEIENKLKELYVPCEV